MTRGWRRRLAVPRPTAWRCFIVLLLLALGAEYWNKEALPVGPIVVPWPLFLVALGLLPLVIPRQGRRWRELLRVPAPLGPLLVFWAALGVSITGTTLGSASQPIAFLRTYIHLTVYVVFVAIVVKWITWQRLSLLVRGYYVLGVAAAIVAMLQTLYGIGVAPWLGWLQFQSGEYALSSELTLGFRTASFFGEASWAARYYTHFIAVALAFFLCTRQKRHLAAIGLFVLALYTANSLLGYVVLAAFVLTLAVGMALRGGLVSLGPRQRAAIPFVVCLGLIVWLLDIAPSPPELIDRSIARIEMIFEGAGGVGNRVDGVFAGLEVWRLAPILGVGLGNIESYIVPFYRDPEWVLRSQHSADSVYVMLLAETGVIGLVAFVFFLARLVTFRSVDSEVLAARPDLASAHTWMRLLQVDLFAQAVGMLNAADYLNPHLWTVVAIVLACKVYIIRSADHLTVADPGPDPLPRLATPVAT